MDNFLNKYPYTDFHELNLDYVLKTVKNINDKVDNFINFNTIKYADPIEWIITSQYQKNTVVIDNTEHIAYLSVDNVPEGVLLTDTDYWTPILDLRSFYASIGDLDTLHTLIKDNLVNAINEISDKLEWYTTPELFGAVGDGITDDSAAFQNALDSDFPCVVFTGSYNVNGIHIPENKKLLGHNATIKSSDAITIDSESNIIIRGLHFITTTYNQETVLNILNSNNIIVDECEFEGVYAGGTIVGVGLIHVETSNDCVFKNVILHDSNSEGLIISNSKHCTVFGGKYYDNRRGSGVHTGNSDTLDLYGGHVIAGVECYNCAGSNIGMSGYRNICIGCYIHDNADTTHAIALGHPNAGGSECIVMGNILKNNNEGIYAYEATDTIICNNFIDGNNIPNPGDVNNGINCALNCSNITVANNTIMRCENGLNAIPFAFNNNIHDCNKAIYGDSSRTVKTHASGNIIKGCVQGCINCDIIDNNNIETSSYSVLNYARIIRNNVIKGDYGVYISDASAGDSFIIGNHIEASSRACYLINTGVFEYNFLVTNHDVTAPNMTAINNYMF